MTSDIAPGNMATSTCPPPYPPCPVDAANPWTYVAASNTCQRTVASPPPVCPANMSGTPCTCNPGYQLDTTRAACIQEQYTLALTPDKATIEPGQAYTFTVAVTKQDGSTPSKPVPVSVKVEVDPISGGHEHGESYAVRPKGSVSPAAGNITFVTTFTSTEISGTHTITATCDLCTNKTAAATVDVKVAGLSALTASVDYGLVGAVAGKHTDNHYLTATARDHLQVIVDQYNKTYPAGPVLHLNDASLVWGGKFDVAGKWTGEHAEHRRGVVIDIRANNLRTTAIPPERFADFEKIAAKNGAFADLHCAFSTRYVCPFCLLDSGPKRHYHVRLLGKRFAQ